MGAVFMCILGVCRRVSGGPVEAGGATFAGLYLGIVCMYTLPKPVNVVWSHCVMGLLRYVYPQV